MLITVQTDLSERVLNFDTAYFFAQNFDAAHTSGQAGQMERRGTKIIWLLQIHSRIDQQTYEIRVS